LRLHKIKQVLQDSLKSSDYNDAKVSSLQVVEKGGCEIENIMVDLN
jgi:hypothetical protein